MTAMTMDSFREDLARLLTADMMKDLHRKKKKAYMLGAAAALTAIMAAAPNLANLTPDMIAPIVSMSHSANRLSPMTSVPLYIVMGAKDMTDAVASTLYEQAISPVRQTVAPALTEWAGAIKTNVASMSQSIIKSGAEIVKYLLPKSSGEAVEKLVIGLAALKSFSEGLSLAARMMRRAGEKLTGKERAKEIVVAQPTIIEHHHHYYGQQAVARRDPITIDADAYVEDAVMIAYLPDEDDGPVVG